MIARLENAAVAAPLFSACDDALAWSCLQGIMGAVIADDEHLPASAAAVLGDFMILAGKPDAELLDLEHLPVCARPSILVPRAAGWADAIERRLGPRARRFERYATVKDPGAFDRRALERLAADTPQGVSLRPIDETLYRACLAEGWSRDLVSQFPSHERFEELAVGIAAVEDDRVVSGASTYARYRAGIEIEVDTRPDRRRRGLARAAAAALILACLDRGLYPGWDAHTAASLALARQLGYRPSHAYAAYIVQEG